MQDPYPDHVDNVLDNNLKLRGTPLDLEYERKDQPTFGAVYCVYDDDIWLTQSLESVYDAADVIWLLLSSAPWHGEVGDNAATLERIKEFPDAENKIRVVNGEWKTETEQRNAGLELVREAGIDYCFVVDADEIYHEDHLKRMKTLVTDNSDVDYWHIKMDTYWKNCFYRIDPREPSEPVAFVKALTGSFSHYRTVSDAGLHATIPPDVGIYHHMSYARPDDLVLKKITTFSHADELEQGWFENVWKAWDSNRAMRNLHPMQSKDYGRAVPQAYDALPPALRRFVEPLREQAETMYGDALQMIESNNVQDSLLKLEQIADIYPINATAQNDLGVLYFQLGDAKKAIHHLELALHLEPGDIGTQKNLADLYFAAGRTSEAAKAYQQILETDPDDVEALAGAAQLCAHMGEVDQAALLYKRALELDPENETALQGAQALISSSVDSAANAVEASQSSEMTSGPLVSIIIPVYNKLELTRACLDSVVKNAGYSNYEIIVVDNASTDGTTDFLRGLNNERVKPIFNDDNLGFVEACNKGAEASSGTYLVFLNNDTEVQPGWLSCLVAFVAKTADCGAVGSKLVYPNGKLQEAGGIIFSDGNGWNYGRGMDPAAPKFNFVREVDYCSGASLLVKKAIWNEIGGFDRRYAPAYYEDTDLCFEIRAKGFKVYYQPKSVVIHHEGQTAGTELNSGFKRFQVDNRGKFASKWSRELKNQFSNRIDNVVKASDRGARKSVLVADAFLPMFDRATGSLYVFQLLKLLKELGYHVTFIARNGNQHERYQPILEDLGVEVHVWDVHAMRAAGYLVQGVQPIDYQAVFRERKFDCAVINYWYVAEFYLPLIRKISPSTKVIIDVQDIHFVRETREAELKNDSETLLESLAKKERELAIYGKADAVWVLTETDKAAIVDHIGSTPIQIRPSIHDSHGITAGFEKTRDLLFVGNFNHPPNIDAVHYFCNDVFPLIQRQLPEVRLLIVGNNPPQEIRDLANDDIAVTGWVEDLAPYLSGSRVSVSPLRYGAGLKGKIAEAMSWGLPVVTTSIGAEGMELTHEHDVLIVDDPKESAEQILRLYSDRALWEKLSVNGRSKYEINWSPEAGRKQLESILTDSEPAPIAKLVSIVILARNQLNYTKRCLESIIQQTISPYELVIVDNGSTDGTDRYLERFRNRWEKNSGEFDFCKDVKVVRHKQNLGYAKGNNSGIAASEGDYVLLLNNDVVVTRGWLENMVRQAERDPGIGIVGPMTNNISGPQRVGSVGYDVSTLAGLHSFAEQWSKEFRSETIDFWRVVGFCMLISRPMIEKIGGLDPGYGIGNFEDDDICIRAAIAGFRCVMAKDSFVHHFGSRTFAGENIDRDALILTNWERFKSKWGLPADLAYGASHDLTPVLRQPFDQRRDFCSVMAEESAGRLAA